MLGSGSGSGLGSGSGSGLGPDTNAGANTSSSTGSNTNSDCRRLDLPATKEALQNLRAGDQLCLYGRIYTMRDAGHARCLELLERDGELPFALAGESLFYAGPTEPACGRPFGAIGPTTASRMDFATPQLLEAGIRVTLGKGSRSEAVRQACVKTGSVYLAATGGAAALLARHVKESKLVAWEDLGTEALRCLELDGLPVFVAIDALGNSIYRSQAAPGSGQPQAAPAAGQSPQVQAMGHSLAPKTTPAAALLAPTPAHVSAATNQSTHKGVFISFEGGEGTGKSTQILLLKARLQAAGYSVLTLREPGSTSIGEQIRAILLDPANTFLAPLAELLLYQAARAQLVREVIRPALAAGKVVLCDRYSDSTVAYQGAARGLGIEFAKTLNQVGTDGLSPDHTIIIARDINEGLTKAAEKGPDRIEAAGFEFHSLVHQAFAQIAATEPWRVKLVEMAGSKAETAEKIFALLSSYFPAAIGMDFRITPELLNRVREER